MSEQTGRSLVLTSVVLAVIGVVVAVLVNLGTSGSGGVVLWVAVGVLALVSGVLPFRDQAKSLWRGVLVLAVFLPALTLVASGAVTPPANHEATRPSPRPLPGVRAPEPIDPDSVAVVARLNTAVRDADLLPPGVTLEFRVSQAAFKADTVLPGGTALDVEALWLGDLPATATICVGTDVDDLCEQTTSDDGTKVQHLIDATGEVVTREAVLVTLPDSAQVMVDQYTGGGELLGAEQTVALALVVADGLAADTRR